MNEETAFYLAAFDHATDVMLSGELEVKQTAEAMTQAAGAAVGSPYEMMCGGFLLGLYEGMRIADTLNAEKVGGDTV